MMYFLGLAIGATFGWILSAMYQACDIEGEYTQPPYDWNYEDSDLWDMPALFTKQRRED